MAKRKLPDPPRRNGPSPWVWTGFAGGVAIGALTVALFGGSDSDDPTSKEAVAAASATMPTSDPAAGLPTEEDLDLPPEMGPTVAADEPDTPERPAASAPEAPVVAPPAPVVTPPIAVRPTERMVGPIGKLVQPKTGPVKRKTTTKPVTVPDVVKLLRVPKANKDLTKRDVVRKHLIRKDTSTKDTLNKDTVNKDTLTKRPVRKHDVQVETFTKKGQPKANRNCPRFAPHGKTWPAAPLKVHKTRSADHDDRLS
jgi:hypothetical protein